MKSKCLLLASAIGLGLTLALLMALSPAPEMARAWPPPPAPTPPGPRPPGPAFIKAGEPITGTGGWCLQNDPCGSIQYAIDECEPGNGDTIYVAQGTYTGTGTAVITLTKSITIYGGWDGAASGAVVRDPTPYPTILDGENGRRVVYITGTVAPVLEGLTLQRGNATGLGGDPTMPAADFGGAVYANNASPAITNCRIASSTAGFGGGMALYYGTPTVGNSTVLSNTANQDVGGGTTRGVGGGIFLYQSPATIVGNIVMNNVASGTGQYDGGGGLYLDNSAAVIRNNTVQGNRGHPWGGGMFLYQSGPLCEANVIMGNHASAWCGGLDIRSSTGFTLTNNIIAHNLSYVSGPGALCADQSQGTLLHNTFAENHPYHAMIGLSSLSTLAFTNTIIGPPGGIEVQGGSTVFLDTTLWISGLVTVTGPGTVISRTNLYCNNLGFAGSTFHLGPGSPAIDVGANAEITTDIDGDPRPIGPASDIGADEARLQVFLPLVLR